MGPRRKTTTWKLEPTIQRQFVQNSSSEHQGSLLSSASSLPPQFLNTTEEAGSPLLSLLYTKGESIKRATILKGGRTALYRALASKPTTCLATKDAVHSFSGQKYLTVILASPSASLFILVHLASEYTIHLCDVIFEIAVYQRFPVFFQMCFIFIKPSQFI